MPIRSALLLSVLACACSLLVAGDDKEAMPKTLVDLAKQSEEGQDITKSAATLKGKYKQLKEVMESYKSRSRKGIGVGPKSPDDGIESKIIALSKGPLTAATLKKERAELIRMAHLNLAIAEMTRHYPPEKPKEGKDAKLWGKHSEELKKSSDDLVKALKADNAKSVQRAAAAMQGACNRCHADFRD